VKDYPKARGQEETLLSAKLQEEEAWIPACSLAAVLPAFLPSLWPARPPPLLLVPSLVAFSLQPLPALALPCAPLLCSPSRRPARLRDTILLSPPLLSPALAVPSLPSMAML